MQKAITLTAGWGTGVALLATVICMLMFIWTGDEAWSQTGKMTAVVAGLPGFVSWLGFVKRHS